MDNLKYDTLADKPHCPIAQDPVTPIATKISNRII